MEAATNSTETTWDVVSRRPFWSSFEDSRVPMCLVDRHRRVVASSEAACRLFGSSPRQATGSYAGRQIVDEDQTLGDKLWHELLTTNQLYAETVVAHPSGSLMRVTYAGHGTTIAGQWHALMVMLSVRVEPDGDELIGADVDHSLDRCESRLTPREREVIRLTAAGANSRQIAAELVLSQATVRTHIANAMAKTNARTRAQLVAIALSDGFID